MSAVGKQAAVVGEGKRANLLRRIVPYIKIARIDHWFKNVFVLPGTIIALLASPELLGVQLWWEIRYLPRVWSHQATMC